MLKHFYFCKMSKSVKKIEITISLASMERNKCNKHLRRSLISAVGKRGSSFCLYNFYPDTAAPDMTSSPKTFRLNNPQQGFAEMRGVKLSLWRYLSISMHARMKKIAFSLALQSLIVILSAPMQQLMAYGHNIFLPDHICVGNFVAFEDQT